MKNVPSRNILLITRPNHDLPTTYISTWASLVFPYAREIRVLDLKGKKANKDNIKSYITEYQPKLLFLNGHGSPDSITGYDNEVLIDENNVSLLEGKITYALSYDAGSILGVKAIANGALAFIGYSKSFVVGYSEEYQTRPLHDKLAELFLEPSNLIPISLLKGNTASDAYRKSQNASFKNFSFVLSTKASPLEKDAAPYLWHNRKYQIQLGDPLSKL